jgi:hypothetical protein
MRLPMKGCAMWFIHAGLNEETLVRRLRKTSISAQNAEELFAGIEDFRSRGIGYAVVNKHLAGDLVKFYGVAYTDFFYWYYPSPTGGKFGLEVINGASVGYSFDQQALKRCGDEAAHLLNVPRLRRRLCGGRRRQFPTHRL